MPQDHLSAHIWPGANELCQYRLALEARKVSGPCSYRGILGSPTPKVEDFLVPPTPVPLCEDDDGGARLAYVRVLLLYDLV